MRAEDPGSLKSAFRDLKCWIEDTLDIFRAELLRALYPLFVHVYLDLVHHRKFEIARDFFSTFQTDFETLFPLKKSELSVLSSVTDVLHLRDNAIAFTYRSHKYKLGMGQYAFDLFRTYLEDRGLSQFMRLISHYFDIKIGRPESDGVVGVEALSDVPVDVRAGLVTKEAEDVVLSSEAYKYDPVEQFASQLKRQRVDTQLRSNSPTLIASEIAKLRDLCARVAVSAQALPSACCYTIFGGSPTCAELSEDCRLLAVGFEDSTIEITSIDGTLRRLKTSAELGRAEDPVRKEKRITRRAAKEQSDQRILSYLTEGDQLHRTNQSGHRQSEAPPVGFGYDPNPLNRPSVGQQSSSQNSFELENNDFRLSDRSGSNHINPLPTNSNLPANDQKDIFQHETNETQGYIQENNVLYGNTNSPGSLSNTFPQTDTNGLRSNQFYVQNHTGNTAQQNECHSFIEGRGLRAHPDQSHAHMFQGQNEFDSDSTQNTSLKRKCYNTASLMSDSENHTNKHGSVSAEKIAASESTYFANKARATDDGFTDAIDDQRRTDIDYNLEHIFGKQNDKKEHKKDSTAHLYTDIGQSTRLIGHSGPVYGLKFFKGNKYLLSCSQDCTVRLWSLELFTCLAIYKSHVFPIWTLDVSPNNMHFVSGGADKHALLWSIMGNRPERLFISALSDVTVVKFHPNANYIFIGSNDCKIRMHGINDASLLRIYNGHTDGISCIEISSCGKLMLSGGRDKNVILWDISTSKVLAKYTGHEGTIYSVAFCWFGNLIASVGADNTMRLWDRSENKEKPCAVLLTKNTPLFHVRFEYRNIISTVGPYQP